MRTSYLTLVDVAQRKGRFLYSLRQLEKKNSYRKQIIFTELADAAT